MTSNSQVGAPSSALQPGRPEVTAVDHVIRELNGLCRTATLEFALSVGKLVVDCLYDSDIKRWVRRGTRAASFRHLAGRPELPMSPGALYRCVATYELCERLGGAARWTHVSSCHMRGVIGLPHDSQSQLLEAAERGRWTVTRLEQEAGLHRPAQSSRGGRPRLPEITKTVRAIKRFVSADGNLAGANATVAALDTALAHEVFDTLSEVRLACDARLPIVQAALARTIPPPPESSAARLVNKSA